MKVMPYENYKPANAGWLSSLPEAWDQIRGRFVMTVNPPARRVCALDDTAEVSFVPMEAVGEYGGLNLERTKPLDEIGYGYTAFEDGDIVIAKITPCFENGKGAIAHGLRNGVGFGTTELHVLRTGKYLDKQFLFYLTISHAFRMLGESEMYGAGGQKRVPPEFVKDFRIPLPPLDEQQTIARFLDAKTAQIDELIARKRQIIDRLKEKRQSLIARTVTRGLPPEAAKAAGLEPYPEMKDSGVVWIGEIPAYWTCAKTAFFFSAGMGQTILKEELTDEGLPVYSATERNHFFGRLRNPKLRLNRGDIVVPARGNSIGHVKIVNEESTTTQTTIYFKNRAPNRIDSEYAFFLMKGLRHHLFEFDQTAIPQITVDQVLGNPVLIPPIDEQSAICKFLKMKETEASDMLQTVEAAIDRLTEYRQALITSAVTGKIDVQGAA